MSERFERIYFLPDNLYATGAPVIMRYGIRAEKSHSHSEPVFPLFCGGSDGSRLCGQQRMECHGKCVDAAPGERAAGKGAR